MRLRTSVLAAVMVAATSLVTAAPAQALPAVTLSAGHVDVIDPSYTAGTLKIEVNDGTAATPVFRDPADVVFQVLAGAKTTVPNSSAYSFLGTPGSTVWILPQTQKAGLLWPGWNTQRLPSGTFTGTQTTLLSVSGGQFAVYTTNAFGSPTVLFDSGNGLPDTRPVAVGTHAHANWAFKSAGTYTVTFQVTGTLAGGGTVTSAPASFTFEVQP
ncbi:choice-of-anchor M domain-containing protein [Kibdelosporangium persicum]|uniref:ABC transporter-associated repeat protein n=1 Tax=Kibdelosporangium persicum TaxID=2698649 RepID=A0ABX2F6K2_9PSEU|nr:choice-of-anchor M domain-containing protein [Kibdelosporangium persicum]NRN66420.1 putative ABC transporter-associated repeat protein [Kibdelosporangium persicum]